MSSDPLRLDPAAHQRAVEATDGAANVCFQCGTCTATCPYYEVDGEALTVRSMMRSAQLGTDGNHDELYRCLTCEACEMQCPRGVDITDAVLGLRELAFEDDDAPGELEGALWSVYEEDNPWERPAGDRDEWLDEVADELSVPVGESADVLYYVGCSPSYDPALQTTPAAIVELLAAADVDFTVLGADEVCCGDVVRQTGEPTFFEDLAEQNTAAFEATGAETIVTSSPHCSETFRGAYDLDAEVLHYTEFLRDLVEEGALELDELDRTVTYHDPCYLARGMAVVDAPRDLLDAAGVTVDEMADSGTDGLCCGGGGGHMWQEDETEERFADKRAEQAGETDAEAVITACPFCVQTIDDGVKTTGVDLPVRDLATVLLEAADTSEVRD